MEAPESHEILLLRYQQGDREAARRLILAVTPLLYRSVRPFVRDPAEAEEILQEAWLKVHLSRHTWHSEALALPWLLAIVRHTRADYLRRHYRRREAALSALETDPIAQPSMGAEADVPDFNHLLSTLPASQREVLMLLKGEGLSLEEVARITGSTIGSVKQKASRAYAKLRTTLSPKGVAV